MAKGIASKRASAVASAAVTATSTVVVSLAGAAAAVLLAREFGRTAETDGFLAAYGVYLVLVLAAQAARVVVLPDLTRAASEGRLASETLAYCAVVLAVAVPASIAVAAGARSVAALVTGALPPDAASAAAAALVWLVPAAFAQILAAVLASALAARDSYGLAALAYTVGAVAGLALFVALEDDHGLVSLAWGTALNGALTAAIPLVAVARREVVAMMRNRRARSRVRPSRIAPLARLARLAAGAAVPLAIQLLYLIALRLAADLGVGRVTSLSYAYLMASVLVAATASSLGLISSVPLTRRGLDADAAAAHVVHASWLSVAVIAAGAGVVALAGARVAGLVLGDAFAGEAGEELGRLLAYLAPWMVVSVAFSLAFPLVFVAGRTRTLFPLALGMPALQLALGLAFRELLGLPGIALALAASTLVGLAAVLASLSLRTLDRAAAGLGRLTLVQGSVAVVAFGGISLLVGGVTAAAAGLVAYTLILLALRPRGLRDAWAYVRALH